MPLSFLGVWIEQPLETATKWIQARCDIQKALICSLQTSCKLVKLGKLSRWCVWNLSSFLFFFFCTWFLLLLPRHDALKLAQRLLELLGHICRLKAQGCLPSRVNGNPGGSNCFPSSLAPSPPRRFLLKGPEVCASGYWRTLILQYKRDQPWRKTSSILLIKDWMHLIYTLQKENS